MGARIVLMACLLLLLPFAEESTGVILTTPAAEGPRQERLGVPAGVAEPGVTMTRHGDMLFEANVAATDANSVSRVMLTETIEISGVKGGQGWIEFIHAFADSTGRALLDGMPAAATTKKGKAIVQFALRRDGRVDGTIFVVHSSGNPSIDDAMRLAVAKSAPFPPLPAIFPGDRAQLRVTFAYNHPHPVPPQTEPSR